MMSISRGRSLKPFIYQLCGEILHSVLQEKYLGVTLSHDLSWRTHINKISQKASQKLGFIRRNLRGCPRVLKRLAYIAFVPSGLEYASSIWDPHLTKDRDTLERIQRRAGCWIANAHGPNVSVTELLRDLSLEPLDVRRRVSRLTFLYKVLNEHVAVPPDKIDLVLCRRPARGLSTRQRFVIPRSRSTQYQESFVPRTISEWNSLPDTVTSAGSVSSFRSRLSRNP